MDIDMSALRALEREKEISFADARRGHRGGPAHRLPAHRGRTSRTARVELDRKSGTSPSGRPRPTRTARCCASRTTPRPASAGSRRRPPSRSSCSGCATPRTSRPSASSPAARATSSAGVDPAGQGPAQRASSTSARSRRCCRRRSRCRGRTTSTALRLRCYVVQVAQGLARAVDHRCRAPTPTWCASCSRSRCPRSPTARSRSPRSPARPATAPRSRCSPTGPGVNAKGACIGPMGSRARAVMAELHGEKIDIVDWSDDPAAFLAEALQPAKVPTSRSSTWRPGPPGSPCPTTSCRWPSAGRARTPGSPPG